MSDYSYWPSGPKHKKTVLEFEFGNEKLYICKTDSGFSWSRGDEYSYAYHNSFDTKDEALKYGIQDLMQELNRAGELAAKFLTIKNLLAEK